MPVHHATLYGMPARSQTEFIFLVRLHLELKGLDSVACRLYCWVPSAVVCFICVCVCGQYGVSLKAASENAHSCLLLALCFPTSCALMALVGSLRHVSNSIPYKTWVLSTFRIAVLPAIAYCWCTHQYDNWQTCHVFLHGCLTFRNMLACNDFATGGLHKLLGMGSSCHWFLVTGSYPTSKILEERLDHIPASLNQMYFITAARIFFSSDSMCIFTALSLSDFLEQWTVFTI